MRALYLIILFFFGACVGKHINLIELEEPLDVERTTSDVKTQERPEIQDDKKDGSSATNTSVEVEIPEELRISSVTLHRISIRDEGTKDQNKAKTTNAWPGETATLSLIQDIAVVCVPIALFLIDIVVVTPICTGSFSRHFVGFIFWSLLAGAFDLVLLTQSGQESAFQWSLSFILEWAFSVDNLFVFHLVFRSLHVPAHVIPKAFTYGIYFAIFLRFLLIAFWDSLVIPEMFYFGVGVIVTFYSIWTHVFQDLETLVSDLLIVKCLKGIFGGRLVDKYDTDFFLWTNGRVCASLLVFVPVVVACVDSFFAFDSITTKMEFVKSLFFNMTSAMMAMLGVKAMFFLTLDWVKAHESANIGVTMILCVLGLCMIIGEFIDIPVFFVSFAAFGFLLGHLLMSGMCRLTREGKSRGDA